MSPQPPHAEKLSSRLRSRDLAHLGSAGLRARPTRAALSALGIAIGIAAMIAVVGSSASSQARLNSQLAELGTNLLTAAQAPSAGSTPPPPLPTNASARVERIPGVLEATSVANLKDTHIYRNSEIDRERTGGLIVTATELNLRAVVGATIREGRWLNDATASLPATVLGATAAERLGIREPDQLVWIGDRNAVVVGILEPVSLAPELDIAALIGVPVAESVYGYSPAPTRVYERSTDQTVTAVRQKIAPTMQPEQPSSIVVSRPSDALAAATAASDSFSGLLLALGAIALIVGGIGVANTMIISVLERRSEIGLRRAIGATRAHIRLQFLTEALILSALGGVGGAALGSAAIALIAVMNGWIPVIPPLALAAGMGATLVVGAVAGLYPAVRAARTPPTVALNM
ncbi:ABC transporter permease [Rhodococcus sp. SRB_17]|nr:ABC transporter permease [Rhodococcus sp. SRB_17]